MYPAAFEPYRQFILHRNKLPISPVTLQPFVKGQDWQSDPAQWTDGPTAIQLAALTGMGVGFLFTATDPFFFVDIDDCVDGGDWSPLAKELLTTFAGCAVEVSLSGRGLHIFGTGEWSADRKCKSEGFDIYTQGRFVALTGTHASGDAAHRPAPDVIARVLDTYLTRAEVCTSGGWTTEPVEGYAHLDDDELLAKAMRSGGAGAVFGGRATFADLWHADLDALGRHYPDDHGARPYDASAADAALAQHLAFWTGRNCERVRDLMQRSDLARDKWERADYLTRTIEGAVARQVEVYRGRSEPEPTSEAPHTPIMTVEDMTAQLVYIAAQDAVGHVHTKTVRKRMSAQNEYAASYHTYIDRDTRAEKTTPAFKAWLGQPHRLTAETATWWPGASDLCAPAEGHGLAFNTWRGLPPLPAPADWQERAQLFVEHVKWLCGEAWLPFVQWLAHIVQNPAELPHTCYLHVTPTTGTGRNWVAEVLHGVLPTYVALSVDIAAILDGKFNGRLSQRLVAVVDETREGAGEKRFSRAERLKTEINRSTRLIDTKYGVQVVERNCMRWLMFSNNFDALPFENSDRRIIVVSNPTERRSSEYYAELYDAARDPLFIGSVRRYLESVDISSFNPFEPAPMTEAKRKSLDALRSPVDEALEEFKAEWPGAIVGRSQLLRLAGIGADGERQLKHALDRAGLVPSGRRINTPAGKERIVIVRPAEISTEEVRAAGADVLNRMLAEAESAYCA